MKPWFALSFFLSAVQAFALDIGHLEQVDCHNVSGTTAHIELTSGDIRGSVGGKSYHNRTINVVEVVTDIPDERTDGFGGSIVGRAGIGRIFILFTKGQGKNLKSAERATFLHIDVDGNMHTQSIDCQLKFN